MTRFVIAFIFGILSFQVVYADDADRYVREAEYYQKKADGYRREAAYYLKKLNNMNGMPHTTQRKGRQIQQKAVSVRQNEQWITTRLNADTHHVQMRKLRIT